MTQTIPSGTYNYVNDTAVALPVVLNESGPDGVIDYSYGLDLMESSGSSFNYFYNFDGLGSVTNLTNEKGRVVERYSYDAWGGSVKENGSVGTMNKFQFTGQALDPATGLYFMRARYYEPASGTFLSRDPFPGFATQPITLNRYIYAGNNPARFDDPSGFSALDSIYQSRNGNYVPSELLTRGGTPPTTTPEGGGGFGLMNDALDTFNNIPTNLTGGYIQWPRQYLPRSQPTQCTLNDPNGTGYTPPSFDLPPAPGPRSFDPSTESIQPGAQIVCFEDGSCHYLVEPTPTPTAVSKLSSQCAVPNEGAPPYVKPARP